MYICIPAGIAHASPPLAFWFLPLPFAAWPAACWTSHRGCYICVCIYILYKLYAHTCKSSARVSSSRFRISASPFRSVACCMFLHVYLYLPILIQTYRHIMKIYTRAGLARAFPLRVSISQLLPCISIHLSIYLHLYLYLSTHTHTHTYI